MGQCFAKPRKSARKKRTSNKYKASDDGNCSSGQPGNGITGGEITVSTLSVNDPKQTQHISERENAEMDLVDHPSDHPSSNPIFISKTDLRERADQRRKSHYDNHTLDMNFMNPLKKSNSCSTIYLDSTVSQPNMKGTIKAVALAIYMHLKDKDCESYDSGKKFVDDFDQQMLANLKIFDEKLHPLTREPVPDDYGSRTPEQKSIYRFIRTLFNQAQLNAECAIVTLVYLERLLTYADFELSPANWKRVTLGAIMLASKVWDDQAVWNVDYCQIIKDVTVEDMNALERQFLQILQFNTNVPASVYAKYYFELREMAEINNLCFPLEPLSKEGAVKLEAMSNLFEDRLEDTRSTLKRSQSLGGSRSLSRSSKAIIS